MKKNCRKKMVVKVCQDKKSGSRGFKIISFETTPHNKAINKHFKPGLYLRAQTIRKFVGMPSWNIIFTGDISF